MLKALLEIVRREVKGKEAALSPELAARLADAPAEVLALARALATEHARIGLGWRAIEHRYLGTLDATWRLVADDLGMSDPREGALARSLQIGASAGGEVYFGLCWDDAGVHVAEVDFEEGTLTWYDTVLGFLQRVEVQESERGVPPVLSELLASTRPAVAAAPVVEAAAPLTIGPWAGAAPEHPFAAAQAHFQVTPQVFATTATPAGRRVLVRRFAAGNPYTAAAVVVQDPDGATRSIDWPDTTDVSGLCLIPGTERALLCANFSGPLIELDLISGTQSERLAKVGWSCGFIDGEHLVVHEEREARVYRYAETGALTRVAGTPIEGFNLFVGHGRVHTVVGGADAALQVLVFRNGVLSEESRTPIAPRPFALHAAAERDGRRLLAFVDTKGACTWFDAGAG